MLPGAFWCMRVQLMCRSALGCGRHLKSNQMNTSMVVCRAVCTEMSSTIRCPLFSLGRRCVVGRKEKEKGMLVCAISSVPGWVFYRPSYQTRAYAKPIKSGEEDNWLDVKKSDGEGCPLQSKPLSPMVEREPAYEASMESVLAWRENALHSAALVGNNWVANDDGPSKEDLETEVDWLLDDVIGGISEYHNNSSSKGEMEFVTWRNCQRNMKLLEGDDTCNAKILYLREPLEELEKLWNLRISERMPLQYLTSTAYWRDLILSVGPGVLIPRPETELLVDFVRIAVEENEKLSVGPWADLGTGSGALAIAVAKELPQTKVYAVDLADEPCVYCKFNAHRLDVSKRVEILQGSWFEPLKSRKVGKLAGIVSNPPYIASEELSSLQAEVGQHEPWLALDGGENLGIDSLVVICRESIDMLAPGGFIALETGGKQQSEYIAHLMEHMFVKADFRDETMNLPAFRTIEIRKDLRGVSRFVTAFRN